MNWYDYVVGRTEPPKEDFLTHDVDITEYLDDPALEFESEEFIRQNSWYYVLKAQDRAERRSKCNGLN
jgi:hypothetical protein